MIKFNVIVSDPPWFLKDRLKQSNVKRGAEANYSTMKTSEIESIPILDITADNAVLALWVPSSILADGLAVMHKWGFVHKQSWIWIKVKNNPLKHLSKFLKKQLISSKIGTIDDMISEYTETYWYDHLLSFGMGRISRNVHEIALIGTRGKINKEIKNKSQRTVFFDKNYIKKHSQKSEILQDRLDLIFSNSELKRLEMFGRRLRENYTVIGNESPSCMGEDILDSITRLKML